MHHQCADGAKAHGLFEFVRPASVVGAGLAAEKLLAVLNNRRVIVEKEQHFAAHVSALEIVPPVLGRLYSVPYEEQRRLVDIDRVTLC